jgi:hypothetical protein
MTKERDETGKEESGMIMWVQKEASYKYEASLFAFKIQSSFALLALFPVLWRGRV